MEILRPFLIILLVQNAKRVGVAANCNLKMEAIMSGDFCTPSLGAITTFEDGSQEFLYAYKLNDTRILQRVCDNKVNCSAWASLGHPRLKPHVVFGSDNDTLPLSITTFSISSTEMTFSVEFLTASQKQELARAASTKHGWFVPPSSILGLPLSRLECEIELLDNEGESFTLYGSTKKSLSSPETVYFSLPTKSAERAWIEKHFKSWNTPDLLDPNNGYNADKLSCLAVHGERNVRQNTVTLNGSAYEKLVDHLFGADSNVSFVTRKQWRSFVSTMYDALQVSVNFRLSLFEFAKMFGEKLLRVGGATKIATTKWDIAMTLISPFGQHDCIIMQNGYGNNVLVSKACNETQIKHDLRSLLTGLPRSAHARVDMEYLENMRAEGKVNGHFYLDALDLGSRFASESHVEGTKTIGQLLFAVNNQSDSDIVWQSERNVDTFSFSPSLLRGMFFYRNAFGRQFTLPLNVSSYTATFQRRFELPFSKHVILQQAIAEKRRQRALFDQQFKRPASERATETLVNYSSLSTDRPAN